MNIIKTIKNIIYPKYTLVYRPELSESKELVQMYEVNDPNTATKLYNKGRHVGFITNAHNRGGKVRAFRFDRIVSLSR